jgi:hypothetical protein
MSALLEVAKFDAFDDIQVEAFDLERLALLPQMPALERTQTTARLNFRATMAALLMALLTVSVLATLPASAAIARACSLVN